MSRVRVALPPLTSLTRDTELEYVRLDRAGRNVECGRSTLAALAAGKKPPMVECYLHPLDSVITFIDLPPLSGSRLKAAVTCAAQAMMLGNSERMHLAHSTRNAEGRVHLAWLPKAALVPLIELLRQMRLPLRGLHAAPFGLAVPVPGQVSACRLDDHWLLRYGADHAVVQPGLESSLEDGPGERLVLGYEVRRVEHLSAQQYLSGETPGWGLHEGLERGAAQTSRWTPALICCVLAAVVWISGLNLYAAREAAQGQALKAGMSQRVKQAFPGLPVILNPLQQARQQLAARQGGTGGDSGQRFNQLLQQAAEGLPFMAGSVQSLTFSEDQLRLQLLAETPQVPIDGALQEALKQVGLSVSREDRLWTLSPLAESASHEGDGSGADDHE
ncbi:type II secretion system protein GspL [Pseudomonas floridensis]|uniref:Type II secretion system protein GspL n=1 Tax=Pseudomonas floridensis TaxID=1958950 RepID=A0A1X0NCZ0_9PSED|nr:type II secretion system protein GspL [Pseudomonas floridensis]ORC62308.1 type II secretion system protein GspL [Pseudomonas floridensis]